MGIILKRPEKTALQPQIYTVKAYMMVIGQLLPKEKIGSTSSPILKYEPQADCFTIKTMDATSITMDALLKIMALDTRKYTVIDLPQEEKRGAKTSDKSCTMRITYHNGGTPETLLNDIQSKLKDHLQNELNKLNDQLKAETNKQSSIAITLKIRLARANQRLNEYGLEPTAQPSPGSASR